MRARYFVPGMSPHPPELERASPTQDKGRLQLANTESGFRTVQNGFDPGDCRLRRRSVRVVDVELANASQHFSRRMDKFMILV